MRLLTNTQTKAAMDLALEEAIQLGMEEGSSPATWRFWQPAKPTVILGTGQEVEKEVATKVAQEKAVDILRRHSGGGAVLIGPGAINFSGFYFFEDLPGSKTITGAMQAGLQPILNTLQHLGLDAKLAGLSDIVIEDQNGTLKKIAGNAQARKRRSVLVHGTLLANPNYDLLNAVLRFPSKTPEYRAGRDHKTFLTDLKSHSTPFNLDSFIDAFQDSNSMELVQATDPQPSEIELANKLLAQKYQTSDWNFKR